MFASNSQCTAFLLQNIVKEMQLIVQVFVYFQTIKNPVVTFFNRYIFALGVSFVVLSYDYYFVAFS